MAHAGGRGRRFSAADRCSLCCHADETGAGAAESQEHRGAASRSHDARENLAFADPVILYEAAPVFAASTRFAPSSTVIAPATSPAMSDTLLGTISVLFVLASCPKAWI